MNKKAFLFSGQGSQYSGMGKELIDRYSFAKSLFQQADDICGYSISRLCYEGTEEELKTTIVSQPAIVLTSYLWYLAYCEEQEEKADIYAGHSLGEYTALAAGGVLEFEDLLQLIKWRAYYMNEAVLHSDGGMLTICDAKTPELWKYLREIKKMEIGKFGVGCDNTSSQIVFSGDVKVLEKIEREVPKYCGGRIIRLKVSGGFHSPLMQEAADGFAPYLKNAKIHTPKVRIISNITARPYSSVNEVRHNLELQLTMPVHWRESMKYMDWCGIEEFVEFGPKPILKSMVEQDLKNKKVYLYR